MSQVRNNLDWTCHFDEKGHIYYYNRFTKEKTIEKPEEFDVILNRDMIQRKLKKLIQYLLCQNVRL